MDVPPLSPPPPSAFFVELRAAGREQHIDLLSVDAVFECPICAAADMFHLISVPRFSSHMADHRRRAAPPTPHHDWVYISSGGSPAAAPTSDDELAIAIANSMEQSRGVMRGPE